MRPKNIVNIFAAVIWVLYFVCKKCVVCARYLMLIAYKKNCGKSQKPCDVRHMRIRADIHDICSVGKWEIVSVLIYRMEFFLCIILDGRFIYGLKERYAWVDNKNGCILYCDLVDQTMLCLSDVLANQLDTHLNNRRNRFSMKCVDLFGDIFTAWHSPESFSETFLKNWHLHCKVAIQFPHSAYISFTHP